MRPMASAQYVAAIAQRMEAFSLHARLGFKIDTCADGYCQARCTVTDAHLNAGGVVHGGVWCTLLDVAAYCAVMSALDEGLTATTVDTHSQLMKAAGIDADIVLKGHCLRVTRRFAFATAEAWHAGELLARGSLTKAILPMKV